MDKQPGRLATVILTSLDEVRPDVAIDALTIALGGLLRTADRVVPGIAEATINTLRMMVETDERS